MTAQPTLADATVTLRPVRASDLPDVLAACQDPETQRWTTIPVPYGEDDARHFVEEHAPSFWASQRGAVWAMCPAGSDRFSGGLDLRRSLEDPDIADVGFSCAPWARERGVTTAALRLACRWGFEQLRLARIEWRAYVGNDASRRVAEKAGFVLEGVQRARLAQRGERRDCWVAGLLPGDLG